MIRTFIWSRDIGKQLFFVEILQISSALVDVNSYEISNRLTNNLPNRILACFETGDIRQRPRRKPEILAVE